MPTRANTLIGDVISGSYNAPCDTCVIVPPYGSFSYFTNPFVVPISNNTVETALFVGNPEVYSAWDVVVNSDNMTLTMAPAPATDAIYWVIRSSVQSLQCFQATLSVRCVISQPVFIALLVVP
jgi:hypothetical protein